MMKSRIFSLLAALPALSLMASPLGAQSVEEFYRGKTITMTVGTSPGGDYDLRMRMVSRHIGKHIPGNPTVIASNMPGAGQMLVANWLASVAPKDGTVIVALSQNMAVNQATGASGVKYDVRQFNWIGNTTDSPNVINAWHTTGIHTIQDVMQRELVVGATGTASGSYLYPWRWSEARSVDAARIPGRHGKRRGRNGWRRRKSSSWSRSA
jgi:tripartite-type tricarboxylate transporter receptor subunit TctC